MILCFPITNIILSNNAYDINIAHLLLCSFKFWLIYTWSFSFVLSSSSFNYFIYWCCCFIAVFLNFVLLVPLNGIKKYLTNQSGGLLTSLMVNAPPNYNSLKAIVYWAIQAGLLTPLIFAQHRFSPLAAFTSGAYFLHNGRRWQWICEFYIANFKGIFGDP